MFYGHLYRKYTVTSLLKVACFLRVMYLWLPSKEEERQEETEQFLKGNRFAILAEESGQVFSRRARGCKSA